MSYIKDLDFTHQIEALILNPQKVSEFQLLQKIKELPFISIIDEIDSQVSELIKLKNPSVKFQSTELAEQVETFFEEIDKEKFGVWVYYSWKNALVHLLPEEDFITVRTIRNKFKITDEEQSALATKKIGIIGLSVGQSVAISLAMERSFGELRIADFDTLELGNMNRLRTSVLNLGVSKTTLVKREIAEIDPFLKVKVYDEGLTDGNIESFFTEDGNLDLVVEECDNIKVKIEVRIKARELGIPVIMDTSDRGLIDIERFDLETDRPIFHGLLSGFGSENDLLENLNSSKTEILMSILDYEKISVRGKNSLSELGKSITSWPQLGTSVIMGGAMCAHFARKILTTQEVNSGRAYIDLDLYFNNKNESKN
ncbi:ThiF family adenylyltransferase [Belliella sp. DSM 107340]|uniref:ThiF family adenylyltransferase n=1 Tax=Belliella calami TaxID=2923436 RepID=A0ABS9UQR1_9BACT|nr:ThiF family adenylyltransferase [Belliella calami]MCH7398967.1 ThiF family adenylyltransferase [Belliella calami]